MSNLRDIDQVPANLEPKLRGLLRSLREHVRSLSGLDGQGNRVILTEDAVQEIVSEAVANLPSGGGGGTAPEYIPDLTAPPTPSSVVVTAGLTNIFIETANPTFSEGHGYARTIVYGKQWEDGQPDPVFSGAVKVHEFVGSVGSFTVRPGAKWSLWLKWLTEDGVESTDPSGGTNGHVAEAGKIGNADLGDLIVEAGNLASGAVTPSKFLEGTEPVTIITGGSVPTTKSTNTIYWSGKLYRWNGTAYVATVPTVDLTGQITGTQVADGAITTPKIFAGAITAEKIAANTITANEIAANAITASELAADAVTAGKVQAGAITTSKLLVTGKGAALNADPWCLDESAWLSGSGGTITMLTGLTDAPSGSTGIANAASVRGVPISLEFLPVDQGVSYLVEAYAKQLAGAGGACYLGVAWYNASKQLLPANQPQPTGAGSPAGWSNGTYSYYGLAGQTPPGTWTRYTAAFGPGQTRAIPSNARFMRIVALLNLTDTAGAQHAVTGLKISQMASADLIVDGSIIASKLAANAIAVGTAAIENGAINNAMIGNAAIDDAKVANLSAAKLTAGDGTIGGDLKSATYSAVLQQGWIVRPDGFAEFNDVVVRGTVFASQGAIGGSLIGANYIQSTNWLNLTTGWRWNNDGTGQVGGIAILTDRIQSGNYSENAQGFAWRADGTGQIGGLKVTATGIESHGYTYGQTGVQIEFDGLLKAFHDAGDRQLNLAATDDEPVLKIGDALEVLANGSATFGGALTADAVNAVNTINLAGNAVTVPVSAQSGSTGWLSDNQTLVTTPWADFEGQPVLVVVYVAYYSNSPVGDGLPVDLRRNGGVVRRFYGSGIPGAEGGIGFCCGVFLDYPGAGSHYYSVSIDLPSFVSAQSRGAVVTALGVKR